MSVRRKSLARQEGRVGRSFAGQRLAALGLLVVVLLGGPGLALSEAWYHGLHDAPRHVRGSHVEAKAIFHHDDLCVAGRVLQSTGQVRARLVVALEGPLFSACPKFAETRSVVPRSSPQPPSRGPPVLS